MNYIFMLPLLFTVKIHVASACIELPEGINRTELTNHDVDENQFNLMTCYCNELYKIVRTQGTNSEVESFTNCWQNLVPVNYFKMHTGKKETVESVTKYINQVVREFTLSEIRAKSLAESLGSQGYNLDSITDICLYISDKCEGEIQMPITFADWEAVQESLIEFRWCLEEFASLPNFQAIAFNIHYWSLKNPRGKCTCRDGFIFQGIYQKASEIKGDEAKGKFAEFMTSSCGETTNHWWNDRQLDSILSSMEKTQLTVITTFLKSGFPIGSYWKDDVIDQWPFQDVLSCALELKRSSDTLEQSFLFLGSIMEKRVPYTQIKAILQLTSKSCEDESLLELRIELINILLEAKQNKIDSNAS